VTLNVALTTETERLVGRDELALMKPSAILINTSRGRVVDEVALIEELQQGKIAGAGLDVFEPEPPAPDNPLLQMDNVIVTPHVAGGSRDSITRVLAFSWQNIKDVWEGKVPRAVVTTA
jgi:phosphoglycerate dehydrogenase-like enzyme